MAIQSQTHFESLKTYVIRKVCGWDRAAPGLEALADNPVVRLEAGPLDVPSLGFRLYVVGLPLLICGNYLGYFLFDRAKMDAQVYVAWVLAITTTLLYLIVPAVVMRRHLQLDVDGFRILNNHSETFVPWRCLMVNRDWNETDISIRIPVRTSAKEEISTTVDSLDGTAKQAAKLSGLQFVNDGEINLIWSFRLCPSRFFAMAKKMASARATDDLSVRQSPPDRRLAEEYSDQLPAGIMILKNGMLQVPFSAVVFSNACCRCESEAIEIRSLRVKTRYGWWMPVTSPTWLDVPVCAGCWWISWLKFVTTLLLIVFGWILVVHLRLFPNARLPLTQIESFVVVILALFPIAGTLLLLSPFWRVANMVFNPSTQEFRFGFAVPRYRDRMIAEIRNRD